MRKWAVILAVAALAVALFAVTGSARRSSDERGWLGVYTQSVTYDYAKEYHLDRKYGAVIDDVIGDSPADKAGLKENDVIVSLNGDKVTDTDDLTDLIAETKPGDKVTLVVVRDGKEQTIEVTLGKPEDNTGFWSAWTDDGSHSHGYHWMTKGEKRPYIGATLSDLTDQLGKYFGVEDGKGALVTQVAEDSPAGKAGLAAGDVITKIDDDTVGDASDAVDIIRDHEKGDRVTLSVVRDHLNRRIEVEVGETDQPSFGVIGPTGVPDLAAIKIPNLKGLYLGNYSDKDFDLNFDSEQFRKDMKALADELKDMKVQFKSRERTNKADLKAEMDQIKQELEQMKKELKSQLEELKQNRD